MKQTSLSAGPREQEDGGQQARNRFRFQLQPWLSGYH